MLNRDERVKLVTDILGASVSVEVYQAIDKSVVIALGGGTKKEEARKEKFLTAYALIKTVGQCRDQFWKEERLSDEAVNLINLMEKIILQGPHYTPWNQATWMGVQRRDSTD